MAFIYYEIAFDIDRTCYGRKIIHVLLELQNDNPGIVKEGRADRELDGEMRLKVLLE